jgi:hypothetical protein
MRSCCKETRLEKKGGPVQRGFSSMTVLPQGQRYCILSTHTLPKVPCRFDGKFLNTQQALTNHVRTYFERDYPFNTLPSLTPPSHHLPPRQLKLFVVFGAMKNDTERKEKSAVGD